MDTHLGAQLKQAREAHGLTLKEIATRTKISVTALEAVERNDFSRLPGGIFGRSFVRAYAVEVGLEPDAVVVSFVDALEQAAREAAERQAVRPEITADDRRFLARQQRAMLWLRIGVVLIVIIAIVALVVWQWRGADDDALPAGVGPATEAPEPAASSGFAPPPSDPIFETVPASELPGQAGQPEALPGSAAAGEPPAAAPPGEPVAPGTADPATGGEGGASQDAAAGEAAAGAVAPIAFDLAISGDCWISYSVDGGRPVAQLFRAGDRRRVEFTRELVLDVGNAGALAIRIDGRPARPLGGSGAHVRRRITRADVAAMIE